MRSVVQGETVGKVSLIDVLIKSLCNYRVRREYSFVFYHVNSFKFHSVSDCAQE